MPLRGRDLNTKIRNESERNVVSGYLSANNKPYLNYWAGLPLGCGQIDFVELFAGLGRIKNLAARGTLPKLDHGRGDCLLLELKRAFAPFFLDRRGRAHWATGHFHNSALPIG